MYEDVDCIFEFYNDEKRNLKKKGEKKIMRKELGLKRRERAVEGGNNNKKKKKKRKESEHIA